LLFLHLNSGLRCAFDDDIRLGGLLNFGRAQNSQQVSVVRDQHFTPDILTSYFHQATVAKSWMSSALPAYLPTLRWPFSWLTNPIYNQDATTT
jgi:hypothetical protein